MRRVAHLTCNSEDAALQIPSVSRINLWMENIIGIDKDTNCLETLTTCLLLKTQQEH